MQPLRSALDAFNASFAPRMTGEVRLRLHRGQRDRHRIAFALRDSIASTLATYGMHDAFDHQAAGGFIALQALPLEAYARLDSVHAVGV